MTRILMLVGLVAGSTLLGAEGHDALAIRSQRESGVRRLWRDVSGPPQLVEGPVAKVPALIAPSFRLRAKERLVLLVERDAVVRCAATPASGDLAELEVWSSSSPGVEAQIEASRTGKELWIASAATRRLLTLRARERLERPLDLVIAIGERLDALEEMPDRALLLPQGLFDPRASRLSDALAGSDIAVRRVAAGEAIDIAARGPNRLRVESWILLPPAGGGVRRYRIEYTSDTGRSGSLDMETIFESRGVAHLDGAAVALGRRAIGALAILESERRMTLRPDADILLRISAREERPFLFETANGAAHRSDRGMHGVLREFESEVEKLRRIALRNDLRDAPLAASAALARGWAGEGAGGVSHRDLAVLARRILARRTAFEGMLPRKLPEGATLETRAFEVPGIDEDETETRERIFRRSTLVEDLRHVETACFVRAPPSACRLEYALAEGTAPRSLRLTFEPPRSVALELLVHIDGESPRRIRVLPDAERPRAMRPAPRSTKLFAAETWIDGRPSSGTCGSRFALVRRPAEILEDAVAIEVDCPAPARWLVIERVAGSGAMLVAAEIRRAVEFDLDADRHEAFVAAAGGVERARELFWRALRGRIASDFPTFSEDALLNDWSTLLRRIDRYAFVASTGYDPPAWLRATASESFYELEEARPDLARAQALLRSRDPISQREGLRLAVRLLEEMGENGLAENLLRGFAVGGSGVMLRDEARAQLASRWSGDEALSERRALAALAFWESGSRESLLALASAFFDGDAPRSALLCAQLCADDPRALELLAWASYRLCDRERGRRVIERLAGESQAFFRGYERTLGGDLNGALADFEGGGALGREYAQALTRAGAIRERLESEHVADRLRGILEWEEWMDAHPGPARYRSADDLVRSCAGGRSFPLRAAPWIEESFFLASAERPAELWALGPATLRLTLRPLQGAQPGCGAAQQPGSGDCAQPGCGAAHQSGSGGCAQPGCGGAACEGAMPVADWALVEGEAWARRTPLRGEDLADTYLPVDGRRVGRKEEIEVQVRAGLQRVRVRPSRGELLFQIEQRCPVLPLPVLPAFCEVSVSRALEGTLFDPELSRDVRVDPLDASGELLRVAAAPLAIASAPAHERAGVEEAIAELEAADRARALLRVRRRATGSKSPRSSVEDERALWSLLALASRASPGIFERLLALSRLDEMANALRRPEAFGLGESLRAALEGEDDLATRSYLALGLHAELLDRLAAQPALGTRALEALAWIEASDPAHASRAAALLRHHGDASAAATSAGLARSIDAYSWERVSDLRARRGQRRVPIRGWSPESASLRARGALLGPLEDHEVRIIASASLRLEVELTAARRFLLRFRAERVDFAPDRPMRVEILADEELLETIELARDGDEQELSFELEAGSHGVEVRQVDGARNRFVRVAVFEEDAERGEMRPLDRVVARYYHVATHDAPVVVPIRGPALLRIDRRRGEEIEQSLLHVPDGVWAPPIVPLEGEPDALVRVYRASEPKLEPTESIERPDQEPRWPPSAWERIDGDRARDRWRPPALRDDSPAMDLDLAAWARRGTRWLSGFDGTWSFECLAERRRPIDEDRLGGRVADQFLELAAVYRERIEAWDAWVGLRALSRGRELSGPTLGAESWLSWSPGDRDGVRIDARLDGYLQWPDANAFELDGFAEGSLYARLSASRRFDIDAYWFHRPEITLFARHLSLTPEQEALTGLVDQDVYTDYKREHRYGWRLGEVLEFQPWLDTRLRAEVDWSSNEDLDPLASDVVSLGIGWRQQIGPLGIDLDYRWSNFFADGDRRGSFDRSTVDARVRFEAWTHRRSRAELVVDSRYDLRRSDFTLLFGLIWTGGGDDRAYRDFAPWEIGFRDLRAGTSREAVR